MGHSSGQVMEKQAFKMPPISLLPARGWQEQTQASTSRAGVSGNVLVCLMLYGFDL